MRNEIGKIILSDPNQAQDKKPTKLPQGKNKTPKELTGDFAAKEWTTQREMALQLVEKMKQPLTEETDNNIKKGISNLMYNLDKLCRVYYLGKNVGRNIDLREVKDVLAGIFEENLPRDIPENFGLQKQVNGNNFVPHTRKRTAKLVPKSIAFLIIYYGLDGTEISPIQLAEEQQVTITAIQKNRREP